MPLTPDRTPGPAVEEELQLEDLGQDPSVVGGITNNAGAIKAKDSVGIFDIRSGGGLSEAQHEVLDTFVHGLAEDAYIEITRSAGKVSNVTAWETSSKLKKLREVDITRTGGRVSQLVAKLYDSGGSEVTSKRLTVDITRTGGRVSSIDMTEGI
jgi:hypothetical protein